MNIDVCGADHPIAPLTYSHRVVVIFKHPNAELLIQRTNLLVDVTPQTNTVHGEHMNVCSLAIVCPTVKVCEGLHLPPGLVGDFDPSLIPNRVCHRSDETHCRIAEVPQEPAEP